MSYDDDIKIVLTEINNGTFSEAKTLPSYSRDKLKNLLLDCEHENFLSHKSPKGQPLIQSFYGGEVNFMLHPSTFLTRDGRKFIEGVESTPAIGQQFNINSVSGSNIGNHGTINNYGTSIEEIKSLIDQLSDPADKEQAVEMVNVIENEPVKPGILKRFDGLLSKYPNIATAAGKVLLSIATGVIS